MPTIEVPTPSAELLAQLENVTIEANQAEAAAIAAIREKFAPYAKHNGYIRIGNEWHNTSNTSWEREAFHVKDGKKVHALLCVDDFSRENNRGDQNRGIYTGSRLYLTEAGEWLEIVRSGSWSQWQGEGGGWGCGNVDWDGETEEEDCTDEPNYSGRIVEMMDEEVAAAYKFSEILKGLGSAMAELCKKLPERYNRLKANAELAARTVEALK